jgi:hypothetical protein
MSVCKSCLHSVRYRRNTKNNTIYQGQQHKQISLRIITCVSSHEDSRQKQQKKQKTSHPQGQSPKHPERLRFDSVLCPDSLLQVTAVI